MGRIAVVTDSTSDLPEKLASDAGVRIIPLSVVFEGLVVGSHLGIGGLGITYYS